MANLPRFGRPRQPFTPLPRPDFVPQPTSKAEPEVDEPEYTPFVPPTTQTLSSFEPIQPPKVSSLPSSPIRESSRVPSPAKKFASPSSSPKPRPTASSPTKPATSSPTSTYKRYDGDRRASATSSPKVVKPTQHTSPPLSPKYKQPAAPLSPLILPRSEAKPVASGPTTRSRSPPEVEQKSILFQKTAAKPEKSDRQLGHSYDKPPQKQQGDVIKIKGENVGAIMHINQSSKGTEIVKKNQTEGSGHGNDERKTGAEDEKAGKLSSLPITSFINSNFQTVNNSVLYNSSCSHRDPGVLLAFSEKPSHVEPNLDSRS